MFNTAQMTDVPQAGQIHISCGTLLPYLPEVQPGKVFLDEHGSIAERYDRSGSNCFFYDLTKRIASGTGWFTYSISVDRSTPAPLYLSMFTSGEVKVSINGCITLLDTGHSSDDADIPREFKLADSSIWEDGSIEIKFEDADPEDVYIPGKPDTIRNAANIYWVELGPSSYWRDLVRHIVWDTSGIVWQAGYYDGSGNEFKGTAADYTVDPDSVDDAGISGMKNNGTVSIHWNQAADPLKNYWLLVGTFGGDVGNKECIYVNGVQKVEHKLPDAGWMENSSGARVYDIDVTELLAGPESGNMATIQMAPNSKLDFAALVEATRGYIKDSNLRVVFKGDEAARNWTRLVNTTMFWITNLLTDRSTGKINLSLPNGYFNNAGYYLIDNATNMHEIGRWGYFNLARQLADYKDGFDAYKSYLAMKAGCCFDAVTYFDVGAMAIIIETTAHLIKADNFEGAYTSDKYCKFIKAGLDFYCRLITDSDNPYHLIKGRNIETSGRYIIDDNTFENIYSPFDSSIIYTLLKQGVEIALHTGRKDDADYWDSCADMLYNAINTHFIVPFKGGFMWHTKPNWLDDPGMDNDYFIPDGTFRYGLTDPGLSSDVYRYPNEYNACWFSIGNEYDAYYGYKGTQSEVAIWADACGNMLDYFTTVFWKEWKTYGDIFGFGTGRITVGEQYGRTANTMLMCDRMDMFQKCFNHFLWNSCDLNFPQNTTGAASDDIWRIRGADNMSYVELTPWMIQGGKPEPHDTGVANYEDFNGSEAGEVLRNVRKMAGVDDTLYGEDNLVIIPRLPRNMEGVKVNGWPVKYRDAADNNKIKKTLLSYDYIRDPVHAALSVNVPVAIKKMQMRFGPFEKTDRLFAALVNGADVPYIVEDRGDSRWIWVEADTGGGKTPENIVVNVIDSGRLLFDSFESEDLSGWTQVSGVWRVGRVPDGNTEGRALAVDVLTPGDERTPGDTPAQRDAAAAWGARIISNLAECRDVRLSAKVKIECRTPDPCAASAGISFRNNDDGSTGYRLVMDAGAGRVRLYEGDVEVRGVDIDIKPNRTYTLKAEAKGTYIRCYLDGAEVFNKGYRLLAGADSSRADLTDADSTGAESRLTGAGRIGLYAGGNGSSATVYFDDVLAESPVILTQGTYDDSHAGITYSSLWNTYKDSRCYGGYWRCSNIEGAYYEFTYTGTGVKIFGCKGNVSGRADVYLDDMDIPANMINLHESDYTYQGLYFDTTGLKIQAGTHTVRIKVRGDHDPDSDGSYVGLDKIEVY